MINVSTAVPTPPPGAAPAPGKAATDGFREALDALSDAPAPPGTDVSPCRVPIKDKRADAPNFFDTATGRPLVKRPGVALADSMPSPGPGICGTPGRRHALAEDGKTLPDGVPDDDVAPAPMWLPVGLVLPVPPPVLQPLAPPLSGRPVSPGGEAVTPPPAAAYLAGTVAEADGVVANSPAPPDGTAASILVPVGNVAEEMTTAAFNLASAVPASRVTDDATPDLPRRIDAAATIAPQWSPPTPPVALPAGQAFAAAIAAAVQPQREEREPADARSPFGIAAAMLDTVHTPAVAAVADARHGTLDLTQDRGLQGMIDHIEVLRDGADANDTRIRLVPDALGTVDVSVRTDGERVHVHFSAENQASARLLSDAQPRLAELADARGVKLGQTSVDSGDGSQRRPSPAAPILSTTPVAARDPADLPADHRVA